MKTYAEYKETGLDWLGKVPKHWEIVPNRYVMKNENRIVGDTFSDYTLLSLTLNGVIKRDMENAKGKFPKDFFTYKIVLKDEIIFCLFDIDETPRAVGLSRDVGMITGAYDVFSIANIHPCYLNYYYLSIDMIKGMRPLYTGLRKVINVSRFLSAKLPLPPREEQDKIVDFLDHKIAKIDEFIKNKKKLIELLNEQKQVVINHTVTKGLNPDVEMKDSGIDWLGVVPKHWEVCRCKYLFKERNERSEKGLETHLSMSQKYGLIPDTDLDERRMLSASYSGGKICYKDDIVLNRLKAHLGVFALSIQHGVVSPDYTVLTVNKNKLYPPFAELLLKSNPFRKELRVRVRGVVEGFWRLYTEDFNAIQFICPSVDEQVKIVEYLKQKNQNLDAVIAKTQNEITLIQEYKTSLISAVVTGQVDVKTLPLSLMTNQCVKGI